MQTAIDVSQVVNYTFDLSHHSDGWVTPFGRAVARVPYEAAVWKPGPNTASIYEVTAHAVNYLNRLNPDLKGEKRDSFEDWPGGSPSKAEWEELIGRVKTLEDEVRQEVGNLSSERLAALDQRGNDPLYESVVDIAVHDAYHSGQIIKLMQLWKDKAG